MNEIENRSDAPPSLELAVAEDNVMSESEIDAAEEELLLALVSTFDPLEGFR
jgi:hypothetical protein